MAWNYAGQIHALTGFDADSTADSETEEDNNLLANQWLVDAAKDIINSLPPNLLKLCSATQTFTSAAVGSEAETLNTGKILSVFAGSVQAREIPNALKHKANDPDSIEYATLTDPVYYVESNKINVIPSGISTCKYEEVQYPPNSTSWDGSNLPGAAVSISVFPDEAEHLVPLRAAITAAEYQMAIEEDVETYGPVITNLKNTYEDALNVLKTGSLSKQQQQQVAQ